MAVVGEAHVIIRALTSRVEQDIRNGLKNLDGSLAGTAGSNLGDKFSAGFNRNVNSNMFMRIADGIRSMAPAAESSRMQLNALIKTGYKMNVGFSLIAGTIGVLIGGLGALVGAAGGAAASMTALIGTMISLKVGGALAGFAMKGVSQAVSSAGKSSATGAQDVKKLRDELKKLRFEAEEAALAEEEAGLRLEQARENLARTADLPVNSMMRREAELNFKQAELAYRKAKDRTNSLKKETKKGIQNISPAAAGTDPFAGLTESQKKFAQFLITLKPLLSDLRERVAKGFLPVLQQQMQRLIDSDVLQVIKDGFGGIGTALGEATKKFTTQLIKPKNVKSLGNVFEDVAYVIENFGKTAGKFLGIFLKLLDASGPLIRNFSDYLDGLATDFIKFLDGFKKKDLENFFTRAGEIAGDFGELFRNIFDGLGAIIMANFQPGSGGDMLLQFLIDATEGFSQLGDNADGLDTYFKNVAGNLITILDGVGGIFSGLVDLGQDKRIGQFFDRIKDAAPAFGELATKGMEALDPLGDLFVNLSDIVNTLTDSGAITTFFTVLAQAAQEVADILKNQWVVNLLNVFGIVKAITLAIGSIKQVLNLITFGVLGNTALGFENVGKFIAGSKTELSGLVSFGKQFGQNIGSAGKAFNSSFNPGLFSRFGSAFQTFTGGFKTMSVEGGAVGKSLGGLSKIFLGNPWVLALTAIIGLFTVLYNTNEDFRKALDNVFGMLLDLGGQLLTAFQPVVDQLGKFYEDLIKPLLEGPNGNDGLISGLVWFAENVLPEVVKALETTLVPAFNFVGGIIASVIQFFNDFIEGFKIMVQAFGKLFTGDFVGFMKEGIGGFVVMIMSVVDAIANVVVDIVNYIIDNINSALAGIGDTWLGDWVKDTFGFDVSVGIPKLTKVNFAEDVISSLGLAKGGVVMPRAGGTMALIAEAGRPERVEPLDPDGLSKRDKAMINYLTGGTGGINITVNAAPGMDESELAAIVSRRISYELRRGATA